MEREKWLTSSLVLLASIAFWGALIYRLYAFNATGLLLTGALSLLTLTSFYLFYRPPSLISLEPSSSIRHLFYPRNYSRQLLIFSGSYLLTLGICFYILFAVRTGEALVSPWQAVPGYFFLVYIISTALLLSIIFLRSKLSLFFIILHYFLSFSIALVVYKIGYGFDPFIHQATMELIEKKGVVEPKPYYYLGQYGIMILLHKITFLSISFLNKILVPVTGAVLLPIAGLKFLDKWLSERNLNLFLLVFLLILPFSFLIMTTPQNLSYIFLLITILFGLSSTHKSELLLTYLFAFATTAIHPLTGIPALLFTFLLTIYQSDLRYRLKRCLYILFFLLSSIALPTSFYILNKIQPEKEVNLNFKGLADILPSYLGNIPDSEGVLLNFVYLYEYNLFIVFTLLVLAGGILAIKHRKHCRVLGVSCLMGVAIFLSFLLTEQLSFEYLIQYEQGNYAARMLTVSAFFFLPLVILALYNFLEKLKKQKMSVTIPIVLFLIVLLTSSLYLTYPRKDDYHNSHGYSVSEQTKKAVHWIEKNTQKDHIVLANQQVSVTALNEFGFDRYLKEDIYFYPIPTGGKLYDHYLDMVYKKASADTMKEAMEYAGVKEGYFVLNKYWWAFPKIRREAKMGAEEIKKIGDGDIYIFKYEL